jgi:predicted ATPase/DNA-binding XRE family transcriptional regulator
MSIGNTLGQLLKQYRTRRGLTQDALAEQVGCAAQTVRKIEAGQRRPSPPMALRFAQILALNPDEREHFLAAAHQTLSPSPEPEPVAEPKAAGASPSPLVAVVDHALVGRMVELAVLERLLQRADTRLLTITGPGGVGKTRLVHALVASVATRFADGAAFVSLAPLGDALLVPSTIAQTLGLQVASGDPRAALHAYLQERHLLLVLDNFEHLLDAAPEVTGLLEACPRLTVLVTSRAPLQLRSEQVYPLGPLTLPDPQQHLSPDQLHTVAAVQLFVQRTQHANPAFALTSDNAAPVAALCRRLDGLPLALELAAPRVRLLGLPTLLARLDRALPLLSDGARDLPARQRTIEATIRWSYDLLTPDEQALFRCLAVFAGGADLEAIEAVGEQAAPDALVLDLLDRLVTQSLVLVADDGQEGVRYRLLEPVRQFAQSLLEAAGEATEVHRRHAAFFLQLAEQAHPELRRAQQVVWLHKLGLEHDNLRAALGWSLQHGDAEIAARIGWALWPFWWIRNHHPEGRRWTDAVRALGAPLPLPVFRRVTMAAAAMAYGQADDTTVDRYMDELIGLSHACGGDPHAEGYAYSGFGLVALNRGQLPDALRHLETARRLLDQSGEAGMAAQAQTWIGTTLLLGGDYAGARERFKTGLAAGRAIGDRLAMTNALFNLAQMALATGEYRQAGQWLREGIPLSQQMDDRANVAFICEGLAVAATALGHDERAATLFGAAQGLIERIGLRGHSYYQPDRQRQEQAQATLRERLGEAAFVRAYTTGQRLGFDQIVAYALRSDGP